MKTKGLIVKNISNTYTVKTSLKEYNCIPRGIFRFQNEKPVVGDYVEIDTDTNTITKIYERKNYSKRPEVANVSYALIVTSVKEPNISYYLLDKIIAYSEHIKVKPILIFSKLDLLNKKEKEDIKKIMKYYKKIGYTVLKNTNSLIIKFLLKGKISFLIGQTGAGKSTLINKLNKKLNINTSPISKALGRGVHTTRHTEIYKINNFYLIDTPGFSALDLEIKKEELKKLFKEFNGYSCKYINCNHNQEDCEILKAVNNKKILKTRYESYLKILSELK